MNEMQRTQFDDARLDLLSLVIGSRMFDQLLNETYAKDSVEAKAF